MFISTAARDAKVLRILKACVLVNYKLYQKSVSLLELSITFDERFKVPSAPFFIPDFNLLSCKLNNFTLKVLYQVILDLYNMKVK